MYSLFLGLLDVARRTYSEIVDDVAGKSIIWEQINASLLTCARRTYSEIVDDVAGKSIIWDQINACLLTCDMGYL